MGSRAEFRPVPPPEVDALPGARDPNAYFYACSGDNVVLLCEHGEAARWRNAVMFTADEARRLGMRLMAMADQAEIPDPKETL